MTPVGIHVGFDRDMLACDEQGLIDFAKLCVRSGVTTATDLAGKIARRSGEHDAGGDRPQNLSRAHRTIAVSSRCHTG